MKLLPWIVFTFGIGSAICSATPVTYPPPPPPSNLAYAPYILDQPLVQGYLNEFWNGYGMAAAPPGEIGAASEFSFIACCFEWDSMKACWQNENTTSPTPYVQMKNALEGGTPPNGYAVVTAGLEPAGYLWPDRTQQLWFQSQPGHGFHFDQEPGYICAVYNEYMWTKDSTLLGNALSQAESAMSFMLANANGTGSLGGLFLTPVANGGGSQTPAPLNNTGLPNKDDNEPNDAPTTGGAPSTYMDSIQSGYADAWIDADYYTALQDMVELENAANRGGSTLSIACNNALQEYQANYQDTFWNSETGRFVGWVDTAGDAHDSGYTYVNLEALARGLGSPAEAYQIFQWLDNTPAQAIDYDVGTGSHNGSTDPYDLVAAPRTETMRVPNEDWDTWSVSDRNVIPPADDRRYGFGAEDGGGLGWVNYYDVMSRLKYLDADNAYIKLTNLLWRCASDPSGYFLSCGINANGNHARLTNGFGEKPNQLAMDGSETGICALSMLNGFMGVHAQKSGLNITPQLPSRIFLATNNDVEYGGNAAPISESRGMIISSQEYNATSDNRTETLSSSTDTMEQRFTPPSGAFNTVAVFVSMNVPSGVTMDITLNSVTGTVETPVASERATIQENPSWVYCAFPSQTASGTQQYSIQLSNVSNGSLTWYQNSSGTLGSCYHNGGTPLSGSFDTRVAEESLNSNAANFVTYNISNTNDLLSASNPTEGESLAAAAPFCRVAVRVGTVGTTNSGCTIILRRLMGIGTNNWQTVATQEFDNVVQSSANQGWLTMNLADQPAGSYQITLNYLRGQISWFRETDGTSSALSSPTNGTTVLAGIRDVKTQGQIYNLTIGSPPMVTTTVNAGSSFIYLP